MCSERRGRKPLQTARHSKDEGGRHDPKSWLDHHTNPPLHRGAQKLHSHTHPPPPHQLAPHSSQRLPGYLKYPTTRSEHNISVRRDQKQKRIVFTPANDEEKGANISSSESGESKAKSAIVGGLELHAQIRQEERFGPLLVNDDAVDVVYAAFDKDLLAVPFRCSDRSCPDGCKRPQRRRQR